MLLIYVAYAFIETALLIIFLEQHAACRDILFLLLIPSLFSLSLSLCFSSISHPKLYPFLL